MHAHARRTEPTASFSARSHRRPTTTRRSRCRTRSGAPASATASRRRSSASARKSAASAPRRSTPHGRMLGFVFGLTGVRDGRLVHWSDMLAVREEARGKQLGERLKHYQRDVVRAIGVRDDVLDVRSARRAQRALQPESARRGHRGVRPELLRLEHRQHPARRASHRSLRRRVGDHARAVAYQREARPAPTRATPPTRPSTDRRRGNGTSRRDRSAARRAAVLVPDSARHRAGARLPTPDAALAWRLATRDGHHALSRARLSRDRLPSWQRAASCPPTSSRAPPSNHA